MNSDNPRNLRKSALDYFMHPESRILNHEEQLKYFFRIGNFPWWQNPEVLKSDPLHRANHSMLVSAIEAISPESILDAGCGCGWLLMETAKYVSKNTVGMDISEKGFPKMSRESGVGRQESVGEGASDRIFYVAGDAEKIPFKDNYFNCVVCSQLLEHLPALDKALQEVYRVMRSGGFLLATVPNLFCWDSIEGQTHLITRTFSAINLIRRPLGLREIYHDPTHVNRMSPAKWKTTFEQYGFTILEEKPVYLIPYIPYFLKPLKRIEARILHQPNIESAYMVLERWSGKLFPFNRMGQLHFFLCLKS